MRVLIALALTLTLGASVHAKEVARDGHPLDRVRAALTEGIASAKKGRKAEKLSRDHFTGILRSSVQRSVTTDAEWAKLQKHQAEVDSTTAEAAPRVACAPLSAAANARSQLRTAADTPHLPIETLYSSKEHDLVCYIVRMDDAQLAAGTEWSAEHDHQRIGFLFVDSIPSVAKLAPGLVSETSVGGIKINAIGSTKGLKAQLLGDASPERVQEMISAGWSGAVDWSSFYHTHPTASHVHAPLWSSTMAEHQRMSHPLTDRGHGALDASSGSPSACGPVPTGVITRNGRQVSIPLPTSGPSDLLSTCAVGLIVHLANQPEVVSVAASENPKSKSWYNLAKPAVDAANAKAAGASTKHADPGGWKRFAKKARAAVLDAQEKGADAEGVAASRTQPPPRPLTARGKEGREEPTPRRLNEVASSVLQSGGEERPLWDAGITGEGQFVCVMDTGLDDRHCHFKNETDGNYVTRSSADDPHTDYSYRKVVQYIAFPYTGSADDYTTDYYNGHGTHVAGTVAGMVAGDVISDEYLGFVIHMADSYGDGWSGNYYFVTDEDGATLCSGTLSSGSYGTEVCGVPAAGCFGMQMTGTGSYADEVYWGIEGVTNGWTEAGDTDLYSFCFTEADLSTYTSYPEDGGVAPYAKIMVFDFADGDGAMNDPSMADDAFPPSYGAGAKIHTNSWGAFYEDDDPFTDDNEWEAPYTPLAAEVDAYVYDNDDLVVLFAAGNEGSYGWQSIGSPASAKNVITVGASQSGDQNDDDHYNTMASFSSLGPTDDMRIKPDVCATGDPIVSAAASSAADWSETCSTTSMSGTSMATPAVAGMVALFREFLVKDMHSDMDPVGASYSSYDYAAPSAALLKAMVIHSARNITGGYVPCQDSEFANHAACENTDFSDTAAEWGNGATEAAFTDIYDGSDTYSITQEDFAPNYHQGFGRVTGNEVVPLDGRFHTYLFDRVEIGPDATWEAPTFVVPAEFEDDFIVVTLVWTDPAASSYCTKCLVHDLDLEVKVDGVQVLPNFGGGTGNSYYSGVADSYNNVERVVLWSGNGLVAGSEVTVTVNSDGLAVSDSQEFAVVITAPTDVTAQAAPTMAPTSSTFRTCHYMYAGGGSFPSEISWTLEGDMSNLPSPFSGEAGDWVMVCVESSELAAGDICLTLTLEDSYGDGWNGNTFYWYADSERQNLLHSGTLSSGSTGSDQVCFDQVSAAPVPSPTAAPIAAPTASPIAAPTASPVQSASCDECCEARRLRDTPGRKLLFGASIDLECEACDCETLIGL